MITEQGLMNVLNFKFNFGLPNVGKTSPTAVICNLILVANLCVFLYFTLLIKLTNLWNFVHLVILISWLFVLMTVLKTHGTIDTDTSQIYKDILKVDVATKNSLSAQKDWALIKILAFPVMVHIVTVTVALRNDWLNTVTIFFSTCILAMILRFAILKHLIAKRLRYFRTAEEYMIQVEDMILYTRKILNCNSSLNSTYGHILTAFSIYSFIVIIYPLYTIWALHGAGIEVPQLFVNALISTVLFYIGAIITSVMVAVYSTLVVNEINELKLELDISLTARPCTDTQLRLIYLFIMELHHSDGQLSALGFFDISRSTMSTAFVVATSYLLVLIQFT